MHIIKLFRLRMDWYDGAPPRDTWTLSLFNYWVTISPHAPGVLEYGVEWATWKGSYGLSRFYQFWKLEYYRKDRAFLSLLRLRLGKPIISLHLTREERNRQLDASSRYFITKQAA